jgi:alpha-mannosidase
MMSLASGVSRVFFRHASTAVCLLIALANPLLAQSHPATKLFSPDDARTVEALGSLSTLPEGDWKAHTGVLPHGEDINLDDRGWEIVRPRVSGPTDAMWYRRWIEVPKDLNGYDLTGARVTLKLSTAPNIMTLILYIDGRRSAMGEDLETTTLFDHAKPGEKALVAVKMSETATPKTFARALLHIEPPDGRPSPEDLHDEFIAAATLIPTVPEAAQRQAELEQAIHSVDLNALRTGDQAKFDASLREAASKLEPLRNSLQQETLLLNGQSHIDAAYRWPWTEAVDVVHRTFSTALQLMDEYPAYTFTQSSTVFNAWMADKYPILEDEIKERIKEGRWEIVGGMWVEGDFNLPDGESIVRQLLIGKRWYKQHYGVDVRVGWNPDSFGFSWQLPQIYKKAGVDFFVTHKLAWSETNKLPFHLAWWESPDGSRVLTYFPPDFASTNLSIARLASAFRVAHDEAPGLNEVMDLYGVGDHGGGPTRDLLDQGLHWMGPQMIAPKMRFGTDLSFFTDIQPKINTQPPTWNYGILAAGKPELATPPEGQISIPTWRDELYLEYHRGTYTTQAAEKRNLRRGEEWMLNAEKAASLAWLDGDAYPSTQINDAWKKVLFNGFHDLAAGSGVGTIYRDAADDFQQVHGATYQIESKALHTVLSAVDTHIVAGVPVVIFNPLSWERSGPAEFEVQMPSASPLGVSVLDEKGHVVPSEVLSQNKDTHTYQLLVYCSGVPSLGYRVLHVVPGQRTFDSDLKVHGFTMENANLRVVIDPNTGCITSLYDKPSGFETLAAGACGNALMAFKDTPKAWDAWNIDADFEKVSYKLDKIDSARVIESGPLRVVVRITRTWQNSRFSEDIVLYAGAHYVDVVHDIDWHENHILLKAAFPLAATSKFATFEIPYGTIERPTTRENSWEQAKFEVPAIRWADLGDGHHGFSLINEAKYGYDAKGNTLRLSLLRSPLAPDPNADRGPNHFSYALYPHSGGWKQALTIRQGYEYNYHLQGMQVEPHTGALPPTYSFVYTDAPNVVLTTMKKAEDSNSLVLRFYDWAGKDSTVQWHVPKGATGATIVNLLEQPQGSPLIVKGGDTVSVPVHPFEIQSLRVDYPEAPRYLTSSMQKSPESPRRKAEGQPDGQVDH